MRSAEDPVEVGSLWWLETDGFHRPIKARVVEVLKETGRPDRFRVFDEDSGIRHSHRLYARAAFRTRWLVGSEPPRLCILEIDYARGPRRHACADMDDSFAATDPPS